MKSGRNFWKNMIENLLVYANYMFAILMPFSHIWGYLSVSFGIIFLWNFYKRIEKEKLFYILIIFIVYGLIINLFSGQPNVGYMTLIGYFSHWLLPFVLGYGILKAGYFRNIIWGYFTVFGVIVGISIMAYFGLFSPQFLKGFYSEGLVYDGLLRGLRSHIALAALCLFASFFFLAQGLIRKDISVKTRIFFFSLFLFFNFAILLTGSRGYYIAAFISYFSFSVFWTLKTKNWKIFLLSFFSLSLIAICSYLFVPVVKERIYKTTSSDLNIQERISLYKVALQEITSRPFLGYGPGQGIKQQKYFDMLPDNLKKVGRHPHLHSFYLNFTADFGLVGLLIFAAIAYFIFTGLIKTFRSTDLFLAAIAIGVFWGFIGIFIGDSFDTLLGGPGVAMELFWFLGLIFSQSRNSLCKSAEQQ
ncbi:MAG: O-antigen ligase family protein [Elusimicrobia bacterium]|nr:O-antigen ligase family protein [Elusimicrobiota bacterium]